MWKCAQIKLNAFIICECCRRGYKRLRLSCLRILFETLLSKALVVGVYETSILYSLQADGKRDSLWFLWLVFTCCTIRSVHRLMCNVQCAVYGVELETKAREG